MEENKNQYRNPFKAPEPGSTGDPFVMRYDGAYYLYFSAGRRPSYLYCWKSDNLVDWTHMGVACDLPEICGGYAPEVIYNNGKFYMCTSPHGNGHYLLRADRPEGPYKLISDRIGQRIDGSFFVDDNGDSYFLRAEEDGINYHTMQGPETVDLPGKPIPESWLNGWTEGPLVLRHGGKYFLTYTGNHLLSKCYKVAYSVSDTSPVSGYVNMKNRVILAEVGDEFHGLGHSSSCLAPDMDGAYIIYHSYELVKEPKHRSMNVDRLFFNGARMYANTIWWDQEKPALADYSVRGADALAKTAKKDETLLLTKKATPAVYTAEVNINARGKDFVIAYAGGDGRITVNGEIVTVTEKGKLVAVGTLPKNVNLRSNNAYRITREASGKSELLLNNNQCFLSWKSTVKGGKIGLATLPEKSVVGFVGFSAYAGGSSDKTARKGVPGRMDAVHAIENHPSVSCKENGMEIFCTPAVSGMTFTYPINVKSDGTYLLVATVRDAGEGVAVTVNGVTLTAPAPTKYDRDDSAKVVLGTVELTAGMQDLTITAASAFIADTFELSCASEVADTVLVEDGHLTPDVEVLGWKGRSSLLHKYMGVSCAEGNGYGYAGDHGWTDYEITATIHGTADLTVGSAEVLLRMQKESFYGSQPASSGYGYTVRIDHEKLTLNEWAYAERTLVSYALDHSGMFTHELKVIAKGQKITVYLDGALVIDYPIPMGNPSGRVGLRITRECFGISEMKVKKI
ncbi:MAG: family 43 glycosylhydrolase [Clostridia bacterium]|nr:family 43 glycosylhydrolase [Clostridia bacterium]